MKILIVDDKKENLYLLDALLKGSGYDVASAVNGLEALEKLHSEVINMIISDILMPVMDGFTLCRECKRDEKLKDIPFIFYTATYKDKRDEELALKLGADNYLIKPMEPERLITIIQDLFRNARENKIGPKKAILEVEEETFKLYSERLIKKLEKKMLDLESETTQRKVYQGKLERVNRLLLAIRSINQLIVKENDRQRLIQATCDNLIKISSYYNAWVALFDESGSLASTTAAGLGEDFHLIVEKLKRGDLVTCVQQALKQEDVVVIKDPLSTCGDCPLVKWCSGRNEIAIRFGHNSKVYGLLVASIPIESGKDEDERSLLKEIGGDIAFALAGIEKEEQKKLAEETLIQSEKKYRTLFEQSKDAIYITTKSGNFIDCNKAMLDLFGYTRVEMEKLAAMHIYANPDDRSKFIHEIDQKGFVVDYDIKMRKSDGTEIDCLVTSVINRDDKSRDIVYQGIIRDISERKQIEMERLENIQRTLDAFKATIEAMAMTIEMKDPYTAGHQRKVAKLACAIAREMALPDDQIEGLRMAGLVHDIGKINVPSEILSKPGNLSEIEYNLVQTHAKIGYDILKTIAFPWPIALTVLQHHLRLDGSGYPDCARDKEILLEAKILMVADVVEAMSSHRPYRPALGIDKALEEIKQNRDILYDANVVDACLRLFRENGFKFESEITA